MDKVKLNREQLLVLVELIKKRGISQPIVLAEILDHFACKVEDKLSENPKLGFKAATELAYKSFGPLGFYSLRRAIEQDVYSKYKRLFNKEMKRVLVSPVEILCALGMALLAYFAFTWSNGKTFFYGMYFNPAYVIAFAVLVAAEIIMLRKLAGKMKDKQIVIAARGPLAFGAGFSFLSSAMCRFDKPTEFGAQLVAVIASFFCFYLVARAIVARKVISTGLDEETIVQNYLSSLG